MGVVCLCGVERTFFALLVGVVLLRDMLRKLAIVDSDEMDEVEEEEVVAREEEVKDVAGATWECLGIADWRSLEEEKVESRSVLRGLEPPITVVVVVGL